MTTTPIPAATLIALRDTEGGAEALFVKRSQRMAFAPGALVFPGGRVDKADYEFGAALTETLDRDEAGARVAAIRETFEESGRLYAASGVPEGTDLGALRSEKNGGRWFAELCREQGWRLDIDCLIPWSRWLPDTKLPRVFDTRFYLVDDRLGIGEAVVDGSENSELFWASAASVIESADKGDVRIIFPTRRNLERIAQFGRYDEAHAHALTHPSRLVQPAVEERDGSRWLTIPEGLGYPMTAERLDDVKRG